MVSTFCVLKDQENVQLSSKSFIILSLTFKLETYSELSLLYSMRWAEGRLFSQMDIPLT